MEYNLAKQLKDAGFPQNLNQDVSDDFVTPGGYHPIDIEDVVYNPTLSELIEACGDKFDKLERFEDKEWLATGYENFNGDQPVGIEGESPKEAVANLYLSLNKK